MQKRMIGRRVIQKLTQSDWNVIKQTLVKCGTPQNQMQIFDLFVNTDNTPQQVGSIKRGRLDIREVQKINNTLQDAGVNYKIMSIQEVAKSPATDLYKFYLVNYSLDYPGARQSK